MKVTKTIEQVLSEKLRHTPVNSFNLDGCHVYQMRMISPLIAVNYSLGRERWMNSEPDAYVSGQRNPSLMSN